MKKNHNYYGLFKRNSNWHKLLLTMKISAFLLFSCFVNIFAAPTYSQSTKISLNLKSVTIEEVLNKIEDVSEFYFLYNNKLIDLTSKVNIEADKEPIKDILNDILPMGTKIIIYDKQIILTRGDETSLSETMQQLRITGTVTDEKGNPLPGVTVLIKGTTLGALTDASGKYVFDNPPKNPTLIFSFVGTTTQEIPSNGRMLIDVVLKEVAIGLEEVVVIGYGTQKKVNLTGSVSSVGAAEITKRPVTNIQNLLQGKVPGLEVIQAYGKPGDEANTMLIRGIGTFSSAGNNPLVLIDGISGDMSILNPDDIASVSVLKDAASSAIYGARAANGVILVTTKRGTSTEGLNIEYDANFQAQQATNLPDLVTNSADYMTYFNQARIRSNATPYFTQATIDAFKNNPNDPVHYPNFNWINYMFHTAITHDHHLNISGGNDKTTFNVSLGYLNQPGILNDYDFKKYTALISVESKVTDWITIGGVISMSKRDIMKPDFDDAGDDYVLGIYGAAPNITPTMTLPDGTTGYVYSYSASIGQYTVRNPKALESAGRLATTAYNVAPQFYATIKLGKYLDWQTKVAFTLDDNFSKINEKPVNNYYFDNGAFAMNDYPWHLGVEDNWNQNMLTTFYSTLNFHKVFSQNHNVTAMGGFNQEQNLYRTLDGARTIFPTYELTELNVGSPTNQTLSGTANEWSIMSFFGRINYDYKAKYFFEANGRYDGTSRIAPKTRWGFFPSVSAAWRLSEESFIQKNSWLTDLKLRGSWGQLGNQNIGLYPYQEVLSTTGYPFDVPATGVYQTSMVDQTLKWETTTITDVGLDLNIKKGLFTLTADWFDKVTTNILYQIPAPASTGLSAPTVNYGSMTNKGIEIEVGHGQQLGDFKYRVTLDYSSFKNDVTKVLAPSFGLTTIQEGLPFNSLYMIKCIGIFQNQAEIDASPKQPFNPKPGDLKFFDANGDGVIDSKDRIVVPGAYPKFYGGCSIDLSWKDIDLTAFFQGSYGQKFYNGGGWGMTPFIQGTSPTKKFVSQMWTGEGSTNSQPAIYMDGYLPVTGTSSTYFLYDASYLRLKNLSIGYNIPKRLYEKIGLKGLRVYVSGDNLLTFTKFPEADPERAVTIGRFSAYPQLKIYTFGIKVKL